MRVFNKQIDTDILLNADRYSNFVPLKSIFMYSIAAILTGNPTGIIKLQVSNDPETNDTVPLLPPVNWVDMTDSSFTITDNGETLWNVHEVAYNYVRVAYIDESGGSSAAMMSIVFNGKGV